MAIKIPDAPNIIGSEPVLRQGSNIKGISNIPDFKVDTTAAQNALKTFGEAWALYEEDQNATYLTDFGAKFKQSAQSIATSLENKYKGKDATNLYARKGGFEDQVNKWLDDNLNAKSASGDPIFSNNGLKQRAMKMIDSQKSAWISHFADYEATENAKYRKTAFDANDQANANLILSARTDEEVGNAVEGIFRTTGLEYQGMDPRYIANVAGKKADEAVAAYVRTMVPTDPWSAAVRVQNIDGKWANASGALTSETRTKLMKEIQESYVKNGANNYALMDRESAELQVLDKHLLSQIWETEDNLVLDRVQDQIRAEGEKIRSAREKETEGLRAREVSNLVTDFNNAETKDDLANVVQLAISSGHPELAEAFEDMFVDQLDMYNIVDDAMLIGPDIEERYQQYYQEEAEKERNKIAAEQIEISNKMLFATGAPSEGSVPQIQSLGKGMAPRFVAGDIITKEERRVLNNTGGINDKRVREEAARRAKERVLGSPSYTSKPGSDVELDKLLMAKQDAEREAFEKYHNMLERRKASMPVFTELYSQQANGVLVNPADNRFASLPSDLRQELLLQRQTVESYQSLVNNVPEVDTILSTLPDYKKMSLASQGTLKRFVVENIKKVSAGPGSTGIPRGEALKQLVLSSYANATVPEEKKLRNAIVRNSQSDAGYDVDFRETESALVYNALGESRTVKNNTYALQRKQAEAIIDDFAKSLERNPRKVVEDMREDMIQWIVDGNYDQVIYYIRGFTQRENAYQ